VTEEPDSHPKVPVRKGLLRFFARWLAIGVVLLWSVAALILLAARWIDPQSTAVHMQRHLRLPARPNRLNTGGNTGVSWALAPEEGDGNLHLVNRASLGKFSTSSNN
jgi:hypothetical protein